MTARIPFVDLVRQYRAHQTEIQSSMSRVVESGRFVGGREVVEFEREFSKYIGCRFGVGTGSGSDALRLALLAMGIGPGDEVVTASYTFVSTVDAILHTGANPVFVEIDPKTYTLDTNELARVMTPKVKAVMPVHLFGQSADMAPIQEICTASGAALVEDAAQAHGARYQGHMCGSMGRVSCFSFYPSKNLGAYGDAGFVATNDSELAERVTLLREYGQSEKYRHKLVGFNSRLDALQASVLRAKLGYLEAWNLRRRELAALYNESLRGVDGIATPVEAAGRYHIYHVYAISTHKRDALRDHLSKAGIETGIHYPVPVHLQDSYRNITSRRGRLDDTEAASATELSLPMFPELEAEEVLAVCEAIAQFSSSRSASGVGVGA